MDRLLKCCILSNKSRGIDDEEVRSSRTVRGTKGFAEEIDRRVAQRTAELTAANEQLKKNSPNISERKRPLREGEINLDLIVNSIPVPVAVTSPSGEVEALNQPTLEYFGRTFEELKGWKSSDVVHPDDLQRTVAAQAGGAPNGQCL